MIDKELNLYHGFLFEDPKATEELVAKFSERFIHLAYLYTKDSAAAESVVEDAFALAFVKQKVFEQASEFKVHLYKLVRKLCLRYQRKHRNITPPEDIEEIFSCPTFEQIIRQNEHFRDLYAGMAELPSQYADLLYLAYFNNLPIPEIAEITGYSKGRVYHRLEKAKPVLKKVLARAKRQQMAQEQLATEQAPQEMQEPTEQALPVEAEAAEAQMPLPETQPTEIVEASADQETPIVEGAQES